MNAIFYPAIFHPEEVGYSVIIPDIEGCFTQGETMDEAVTMAQDAIGLMLEDQKVCPKPSLPSALTVDPGDFVAMVPFDMDEYKKKFNTPNFFAKSIREYDEPSEALPSPSDSAAVD